MTNKTDDANWGQGAFIDSKEYSHMPRSWKEFQIQNEKTLVRPSPKGNAICKTNYPDDAIWISNQLNRVKMLELALQSIVDSEILDRVVDDNYKLDAIKALKGGDV